MSGERLCRGCELVRSIEDFAFKNRSAGQRQSQCRACCRLRSKQHYHNNRAAYLSRNRRNNPVQQHRARLLVYEFLLQHACVVCGLADPVVLEFNHLDPQSKSANVSDLIRARCSAGRLLAEIQKCEVVCANCHQRLTSVGRPYHYKTQIRQVDPKLKAFRVAANLRNHELILRYLAESSCVDCGEGDPLVLQFDHVSTKLNHVSWLVGAGCSQTRLKRELDACEVRCANCHRRKTAREAHWFRFTHTLGLA